MSRPSDDDARELASAEEAVAALLHDPDFNTRLKELTASVNARRTGPAETEAVCQAIDAVYSIFGSRSLSQSFEACPCCLGEEDVARLRQTPVRDLTTDDLWMVASNVPWTAGSPADIAYFLPRFAESLCSSGLFDAESIFERLARVPLSDAERTSIQALFDAVAPLAASDAGGLCSTETLVFCSVVMDLAWEDLLDGWRYGPNILDYVSRDVVAGDAHALRGVYWAQRSLLADFDAPPEITPKRPLDLASPHDRILAWLRRPENAAAIQATHTNHPYGNARDAALAAQIRTLLDNPYPG